MIRRHEFRSIEDTARVLVELADEFKYDLLYLHYYFFVRRCGGGWPGYFQYVKRLSYLEDPPDGNEYLSRPACIMHEKIACVDAYRDCDDKTDLIYTMTLLEPASSYLLFVGEDEKVHHIYPELFYNNAWTPFDATFPGRGKLGDRLYSEQTRWIYDPVQKKFINESEKKLQRKR